MKKRHPCLLLVDDTPANIDVLVGLLRSDFELKVANRGAKALEICAAHAASIDLILLDIMMPEMDGYAVAAKIRADPATREIPIIFLTARSETEAVVKAFETGARDYVIKPFRPAELKARVQTQLTLRQQRQEIDRKNAELQQLLQILSHDVANQFGVLSMSLEMLRLHPEVDLNRYLPHMEAAVRNGIGLTEMVRELRRAEEKGLALRPVSLRQVMREVLLLSEDRAAAKQITISCEVPDVEVVAEPWSLTNSVFGNLMTNAIKFSQAGSSVAISGWVEGADVLVKFVDHGIGIPPSILSGLFDIGHNVSRPGTAGEKGTGYGMPLLRRFVEIYGGDVDVQSRDREVDPSDSGTIFTIRLKLAPHSH